MATQAERVLNLGHSGAVRYQVEIDVDSDTAQAMVVRLTGRSKRVLELGCGPGHMSRVLKERGCKITAIELDPVAADLAAASCERVIVGDLEQLDLNEELESGSFDVVIASDVLEHLKDPVTVLRSVKNYLRADGCVIASIPNVAHLSVRLALLSGHFPYAETGLLDRTHLRFFNRESVEQLFDAADLMIGQLERRTAIPAHPKDFEVPYDPGSVPPEVLEALSRDPEASTYQFVVVGYPVRGAGTGLVKEQVKRLNRELDAARRENVELRAQLEQFQERRAKEIEETAERSESTINQLQIRHTQESELNRNTIEALQAKLAAAEATLVSQTAQIAESSATLDGALKEAIELRKAREEQVARVRQLEAKSTAQFAREKDLREMLFEAHDQLLRRDEEIAATLATTLSGPPLPAQPSASPRPIAGKYVHYQQTIQHLRDLAAKLLPQGSRVIVISKGDDDLLTLPECRGMHFPQTENGAYAGFHPEDDAAAIRHLEEVQRKGADFLLIPETSRWWLKHYSQFAEQLNTRFNVVVDEPGVCIIFDLRSEIRVHPPASTPQAGPKPFGVNLAGHVTSEKGVGEGARSTVRVLRAANVPVLLNNFIDPGSHNTEPEIALSATDNPYAVNLLHMNADELPTFLSLSGEGYFRDRYNIGYWAWELSRFPIKWMDSFKHLDEIWVPSNFVLDSVSRCSPIPIVRVPHAIPEELPTTAHTRSYFGLPKKKYLFLFMFDFMSIMERKNPLGLIEAFKKAFKPSDDVVLVLKGVHANSAAKKLQILQSAAEGANVKFLDAVLSKPDTNALIKLCDCYVSLHRSEGFGLTMAEAMSLGKPVIATAYSGNMDFMTQSDSFLVNYHLTPLSRDYEPYERGSLWAEPDLNHAAELMRLVYEDKLAAERAGRRARRAMLRQFAPGAIAQIVRTRLAALNATGKVSVPEQVIESSSENANESGERAAYRDMIGEIRQTIEAVTPGKSIVAVISKGDDDLLEISRRKVWHFPRQEDGTYAGHHPADSTSAIAHLEAVRRKGVRFLAIPQAAFWWLDFYEEFRSHLDSQHRRVWHDDNCIIYRLAKSHGR
jgi:2-polyprenyl-3-methyl-5-hydroxy-6-metoxy-1,4-benzoquinol methylase/glycosyltransferase involved in cell wall biosynthesis